MNKIWKLNKKPPKKFLEQFPEYSQLILQLLWDRGLKTQKQIDEFFNPDYDQDLHDPFLMKGMSRTVNRIKTALNKKEKIVVFGDYDADGVCSAAILTETLNYLGLKPETYIPDRVSEGYGLNMQAIKKFSKQGINLIITVDCGITNVEEVELANKLGIDVVIIDHHKIPSKLPKAASIIDPQQKGETYPFKQLAAAGVAFKFVQGLFKKINKQGSVAFEKWLLDLVAIATVTDMMPLTGENRTLVKYGLVVLEKTRRLGLRELIKLAGIESRMEAYVIGYILGPRLNAAGRMGHANTAFKLLVSKTKPRARELAKQLDQKNKQRQVLTNKIVKEVEQRLELKKQKAILEGDKNWPIGIAGLIASWLSDKYYRPTIIYQIMGNESKASARSVPHFNIIDAISKFSSLLENFGGHPGAAGFTISNKNLEKFKKKFLKFTDEHLKPADITPRLNIDSELSLEEFNFDTHENVQRLAPFGEQNPKPLFLLKNLTVNRIKQVGNKGSHLKMYLTKQLNKKIKGLQAIAFGLGDFHGKLNRGDKINVVFELIVNEWNGTRELQLKVVDFKKI